MNSLHPLSILHQVIVYFNNADMGPPFCSTLHQHQGHIEPLKAARGHATYIDSKMLSVTKYSFQIYFRFHTCNDASAIANR